MQVLCLIRRGAVIVFGLVAIALTIGIIPHPSAQLARTLMYLALAVAILALGAGWLPRKTRA